MIENMLHYFFDTYDGFVSIDETGVEVPTLLAVHDQVRATLPSMLTHAVRGADKAQFRIDVRDEGRDACRDEHGADW